MVGETGQHDYNPGEPKPDQNLMERLIMADTNAAPNNKPVAFGNEVGREPAGIANAAPMKPSKHQRKTAKRAIRKGMISEKAAKKHLGGY